MTTALSGHRTNQQATTKTVHPKIVQIYFLKEARSQSHEHVGTKLYHHSNVYKISEAFRPMFAVGVAHQSPNHLPEVHIAILLGAELLQNASACVSKRNVLTKGPVKPTLASGPLPVLWDKLLLCEAGPVLAMAGGESSSSSREGLQIA